MTMYYNDTYLKRLNRYGYNYQSRVQTQREKEFDNRLLKSIYRIDFEYNGELIPGTFEKNKQDEKEYIGYLLTRLENEIPNGTILWIPNLPKVDKLLPWMVWYMDELPAKGYHRHVMLQMTHKYGWLNEENEIQYEIGFLYGQQDNMLKNEIRSRSRSSVLYSENLKTSQLIIPLNANIKQETLIFVGEKPLFEQFKVTGYDRLTTPGVMYVTIDPTYEHDITVGPNKTEEDDDAEFYWLTGGDTE